VLALRNRQVARELLASAKKTSRLTTATIDNIPATLATTISTNENLLTQAVIGISSRTTAMESYFDDIMSLPALAIPTPSKEFNAILNGGFGAGRLSILASGPKMGKTTLAFWMTQKIAESGYPVIFVTYELTELHLMQMVVARLTQMNSRILDTRPWLTNPSAYGDELKSIKSAKDYYLTKIAPNLLIVEGDDKLTPGSLSGLVTQCRRDSGCGRKAPVLVVVDSLNKMSTGIVAIDRGADAKARVGRVAKDLKALARSTGGSVLAISEVTKEAHDAASSKGRYDMTCIRDSFEINHVADVLMTMHSRQTEKSEKVKKGENIYVLKK
ncbi:MAG: hypothetical protein EOP04_31745, partial [Proteobacteria bacterium]